MSLLSKLHKNRPSKAIAKAQGKLGNKLFDSELAAKWRKISPIANMLGEQYQRHILNMSLNPSHSGFEADYEGARARGETSRTALRYTYQNALKSAAIMVTIYGAASAGAPAGGEQAAGSGVTTTPYAAPQTGAVTEVPAGASTITGATTTPVPPPTPTPPAGDGGAGLLSKAGNFVKDNQLLSYGLLQIGGGALAGMNEPTAGEEAEEILAARRRANKYAATTSGGAAPTYQPVRPPQVAPVQPMSTSQMLYAGGVNQPGLLRPTQPATVTERAGLNG